MKKRVRKPSHPGELLEELYIKPLELSLEQVADHLGISRNTLFKIRKCKASITPGIAVRLAEAFNTSPQLWLNLQQKYDLWCELHEKKHKKVVPLYPSETDCNEDKKVMYG